jgi:hypothetical protein
MPKYNLALLCKNDAHAEAFCLVSQELSTLATSRYILGINSLPHVSVCQFIAEPEQLDSVWQRAKNLQPNFSLSLNHFYYALGSRKEHGMRYNGVDVTKSDELVLFQEQIKQTLSPILPKSPTGNQYYPHFTLGCSSVSENFSFLPTLEKFSNLWSSDIPVKLALGQTGPDGQFEKILFE